MHKLPNQLYENWEAKDTLEKYLPKDINRIILDYVYEPINLYEYDLKKTQVSINNNKIRIELKTKKPMYQISNNLNNEKYLNKIIEYTNSSININSFNSLFKIHNVKIRYRIYNDYEKYRREFILIDENNLINEYDRNDRKVGTEILFTLKRDINNKIQTMDINKYYMNPIRRRIIN